MATQVRRRKKPRYNWRMLGLGLTAQIIPAGFVLFLYFHLIPKTSIIPELGVPLSIAFGALGATIHYLALKRGIKFRVLWSIVFVFFTVGVGFGLNQAFKYNFDKMQTCAVCGFVTLKEQGEKCPYCHVQLDQEEAAKEGFADLDEYLQAAQLTVFQPKEGDTLVDFFGPCNCPPEFPKDPAWKPSVTKQDVLDVRGMVERQGR